MSNCAVNQNTSQSKTNSLRENDAHAVEILNQIVILRLRSHEAINFFESLSIRSTVKSSTAAKNSVLLYMLVVLWRSSSHYSACTSVKQSEKQKFYIFNSSFQRYPFKMDQFHFNNYCYHL